MEEKRETFNYTYSAAQQQEIKRIREKYTPPAHAKSEDKMERLRRLDASVTKSGTVVSLIVGIIGALIMGTGMSCVMVWGVLVPGIIVGVVGIIGVIAAYPIYSSITKKQREKLAPEIMRLSDELMK